MTPTDALDGEAELAQPLGHPVEVGEGSEIHVVATGHGDLIAHGCIASIRHDVPRDARSLGTSIGEFLSQRTRACRQRRELPPRRGKPRERHRAQPVDDATQLTRSIVHRGVFGHRRRRPDYSRPEAMIAKRRRNSR